MCKYITAFFLLLLFGVGNAQSEIKNGSFEDQEGRSGPPHFWTTCNRGATPDILPGQWDVLKEAFEGEKYLGLITRKDGTWESVTQTLSNPVVDNECQTIKMMLARSNTYANFNLPIRLKVYLGNSNCNKAQLIGSSENIVSTAWESFEFTFRPEAQYTHLTLEAYYGNGIYIYYDGNVLVDMISNIKICPRA